MHVSKLLKLPLSCSITCLSYEFISNVFSLLSESLTWSKPKVQGKPPAARDGHSACVIESRIYIFGGYEEEVKIVMLMFRSL